MIIALMVYNLFFSTIFTNAIYSINLLEFNNLTNSINGKNIYNSFDKEKLINKDLKGINQKKLEEYFAGYITSNIRNINVKATFYYYNSDFTSCLIDECNSVQILLETHDIIPSFKKELNFEFMENI